MFDAKREFSDDKGNLSTAAEAARQLLRLKSQGVRGIFENVAAK